jgi:glyoxylase-like metal-dependent hydrolase (beta-lactamase superfamily II)
LLGKLSLTQSRNLTVHTYTAPDDGWRVNSHIIELPSQLLVVDAQYMLPYAREVVSYAEQLAKPVTRLYLSHHHPDHILGAAAFSAPIYALAEVKAKIEAVGDRIAPISDYEEHEKHGDAIPDRAERPSHVAEPGLETIDGELIDLIRLTQAETENALMIGLPKHSILITQDLIYNHVHVFVGEKAFDSWHEALNKTQRLYYKRLLPGHGDPCGHDLYDEMRDYLAVARIAYLDADDAQEFKQRLIDDFPDYQGRALLDHQMRFLFPKTSTTFV